MEEKKEKITLVVPCYNEEKNVELFYNECKNAFKNFNYKIEIVFVNDGSKDNTFAELKKIVQKNEYIHVKVVNFSRNFGKEAAMYAGLEHSTGEYVAIIDADLQQKPELVKNMMEELNKDDTLDCVCCYQEKRIENKFISFVKKLFYNIINKISEIDFVNGASDFRLLKRYVVEAILSMSERSRFSKGIFSWVGFNTKYLPYIPEDRKFGRSSFNFRSLLKYAISGIISFSLAPLHLSIYLGILLSMLSIIYLIIVVIKKVFFTIDVPGFATIVACILLIGGQILFVLGIIGEYIARIYIETKQRPIYIKKQVIESRSFDESYDKEGNFNLL